MDVQKQVRAFEAGDQSALDPIIGPHLPRMESRIRSKLRGVGDRWAEDAISDLFSQDWGRLLGNYDPSQASVEAYLSGIEANIVKRAFDRYKKRKEVLESEMTTPDDDGENRPYFDRHVADGAAGDDTTATLESCLLLELFLRVGGYPHQQIGFGFSLLLHGKQKKTEADGSTRVAVWGDPAKVVDEYSRDELAPLFDELILALETHSGYPTTLLVESRRYVDARLPMSLRDLFCRDSGSRGSFESLLDRITGETRLVDYFKDRSGKLAVADWCDKVKNRISRAFEDASTLNRNPIPFSREGEEPEGV